MFGIKTRKDKRIEGLENQLSSMYLRSPQIITTQGNVVKFGAIQILEEGMQTEYAKQMIARKLADEAIRFIHYDLEQHGTKNALKGYIQVVTYGKE